MSQKEKRGVYWMVLSSSLVSNLQMFIMKRPMGSHYIYKGGRSLRDEMSWSLKWCIEIDIITNTNTRENWRYHVLFYHYYMHIILASELWDNALHVSKFTRSILRFEFRLQLRKERVFLIHNFIMWFIHLFNILVIIIIRVK